MRIRCVGLTIVADHRQLQGNIGGFKTIPS
jgi:hypothetical protein